MKWGLGDSYDNVAFMPEKVRAYLDITKPASTLGVMGMYFVGSLFYFAYMGELSMLGDAFSDIIFACATVGFAHGASQAMNMAEDAEMDRQTPHKQNRPIPSGVISEEEARAVSWIMSGMAMWRGFMVNSTFGAITMILLFMGIFYNLDPIRAKERIISIPWQAVSRGLFSFPIIWAAYGDILSPTPWILGVFMFFYVMGFQNSADIIDREVDEEYGIRTFVVVFGVKRTVTIAFGCMLMMVSVIVTSVETGLIPESMYSMLVMVPFCCYMLAEMWNNPFNVSEKTGNHPAWLWFYAGMVLAVLIPLVAELIV